MPDTAVKCHDSSYDSIDLLWRFRLGALDIPGWICVYNDVPSHPLHDWISAVDDPPFHQQFIELLGRRRHILVLGQYIISIPSMEDLPEFNKTVSIYLNYMDKCIDEISKLKSLQTLFLQKIIA